ncbi:SPARC-related modular calcium-binding protein 1 [Caerostris extrusa]|uniref:SPARC-related modular calcium-binding protein 1 n=1 Tax=Caerostris extrusa TaxID=172846 RepID=A0AAV4TYL2_CAEEX|nr:SPARC-related modular calcium-binding protein 1 [Caerostris extrusa]
MSFNVEEDEGTILVLNLQTVAGGKRTNRRRSSRGRKNKKGCGTNDRSSFNSNLIDMFQSEYDRVPHTTTTTATPTENDPLRDTHEKQVIQWKFDQLDSNQDSYLKKKELRDLRRMAKKIVKPKTCAKTFAKFCDLDQDKKISRSEWSVCVGVDINISFRLFMSLNSDEQVNAVAGFLDDSRNWRKAPPSVLPVRPDDWKEEHVPKIRHEGHSSSKKDNKKDEEEPKEEPQDCKSVRRSAMENHRQDPAAIYIPEVHPPDGNYVRAQCHRSPQFCWCVHPRSGSPIKGTTTQGFKPDCEAATRNAKNYKGRWLAFC